MNYTNYKKELGQNFIRDEDILDLFVKKINPEKDDLIIEIGPGDGALTERLVERCKKMISIEVDGELVTLLQTKFMENLNLKVTNKNVLDLNIEETIKELTYGSNKYNIKIVGSLPYNISKKIIQKFIEFDYETIPEIKDNKPEIYFLIQKEVAEDYTALSPKSSFISNYLQVYGSSEYILTIEKEMFEPEPKVDGGVIKITIGNKLTKDMALPEKQKLIKFIHAGFASPRKTLLNNLRNIYYDTDKFKALKLKDLIRPAEVEFKDWIKIYSTTN